MFEWDRDNVSHLRHHQIKPAEAEELFRNYPAIKGHEVVEGEDRWTAVGATLSLRVLVLIFTVRNDRVRVITCWDADKRTRKNNFTQRGT